MCGRFTREFTWRQVHDFLDLKFPMMDEPPKSWNVAPTQPTPVCVTGPDEPKHLEMMAWGFVPVWAKEPGAGHINARSETAAEKPTFRDAFAKRRCVVPASGFYEWQQIGKAKQPFYVTLADGPVMAFAGIWEARREGDAEHRGFAILTTDANEKLAEVHDRMPVILTRDGARAWLAGSEDPSLLRPCPPGRVELRKVSSRVNSPKNDDPRLIEEAPPETLF
ncbi:MAG: SOS response-associated peptidase [Phycisphaerales bacterium JB037]